MIAVGKHPGRLAATIIAAAFWAGSAAAEDYPDALLTTPVMPEILAQGAEVDAYAQGIQAYVWGYPLVRMERVARQYTDVPANNPPTSYRAPLNQIGWARELATAASKDMPTSNNDTFYMSAIVESDRAVSSCRFPTRTTAITSSTSSICGRSWSTISAAVRPGPSAGNFALVPPGWKGELRGRRHATRCRPQTRSGCGDGCGSVKAKI